MESITDNFESALARAQQNIESAREGYRTLEKSGAVPDELVETFSELGREINNLDEEIDVSDRELERAEEAAERAVLLESVIAVVRDRECAVIESDINRLRIWLDGYTRANRKHEFSSEVVSDLAEAERYCEMMEQLIAADRHEKIRSNDRFSPGVVDTHLRSLDRAVRDELSDESYGRVCLDIVEDFLAEVHRTLASIDESNPERTAFADSLRLVKEYVSAAETDAESVKGDAETTPGVSGRIALEGALMLQYLTARVTADQELATALAEILERNNLEVEEDLDDYAAQADVDGLLDVLTEVIKTEVSFSTSARLERLLKEHDGSVVRTVEATDFDIGTIFELLNKMYKNDEIKDVSVVFD